MNEKTFEKLVIDSFRYDRNIRLWKQNVAAMKVEDRFIRCGVPGQCDLIGLIKTFFCPVCNRKQHGVFLGIELKVGKRKPTDKQNEYMEAVRDFNGIAFVLTPEPGDEQPDDRLRMRVIKKIEQFMCPDCADRTWDGKGK